MLPGLRSAGLDSSSLYRIDFRRCGFLHGYAGEKQHAERDRHKDNAYVEQAKAHILPGRHFLPLLFGHGAFMPEEPQPFVKS